MRATYDIRITDDRGRRLEAGMLGRRWSSFRATRVVGGIGSLILTVPYSRAVADLLRRDYRISIQRSLPGGSPALLFDQVYLIQSPSVFNSNGLDVIEIPCVDCNDLLRRRIIAYYAGSAPTQVTGPIDDSMKTLVRENLASTASDYDGNVDRALPLSVFTVQADLGLGPTLTAAYAWRQLLDALRDLSEAARTNGTYTTYDVVAAPGQPLQFQTFIGQRGIDRRGIMPPLSVQTRTLSNVKVVWDWSAEVNAVYAGGRGEQSDRVVERAVDAARAGQSVLGWTEEFNYSNGETSPTVTADAEARLAQGRSRVTITGNYQDSTSVLFGHDVNYGDLVPCSAYGIDFTARLDTVSLAVEQGGLETIGCMLRNEEDL
jgi:hypothetical protein